MLRFRKYFILISMLIMQLTSSAQLLAETLAIEIGDENINFIYQTPAIYGSAPSLILDTRLLYSRQNNHQDLFASAGMTAYSADNTGLGVGFKIIAADPLNDELTAISLGAELIYHQRQLRFASAYYYAAESMTYADGKNLSLLTANLDYEISNQRFIHIGYRRIKIQLINGSEFDFDRGAYLGMLWLF